MHVFRLDAGVDSPNIHSRMAFEVNEFDDIRTLHRVRLALDAGRPLPMALRENRVWGLKEKLMERVLPQLGAAVLGQWLEDAHTVDGIVKGLKAPGWPGSPWGALQQMAMRVARACQVS